MKKFVSLTFTLTLLFSTQAFSYNNSLAPQPDVFVKKKTFNVGDIAQGGIIFFVNKTGDHGLVAAQNDQFENQNFQDCLDGINDPKNHDELGQQFLDWRLPNLWEAYKMYMNLYMINVGNFSAAPYWTTKTTVGFDKVHIMNFEKGMDLTSYKSETFRARAVRSF
ncbi:DUF1566 domain-containing protein [Paracrocinitomix mangrovi]|uniref:DUF1566 domain-containing protein n=1 Tax=Paracrocinitomix mangrovi TaxID=2862509 RepID=UPI001C8E82E4|nr:DUF1566 domain-containing protein [Paracrocinitomix mangrovi]UKN00116.1 DUF1566 domain-containing protein [Paracrocinitomix mangrovi]